MIEDELRSVLTDRAGEVTDDNARRTSEVRSRIGTIRRRRIAGAALGLVLLAVAGVALTRLPGRPDALPTAVPTITAPPGPYFDQRGRASVPGYALQLTREIDGPTSELVLVVPGRIPVRHLLVVRCERPGTLIGHNTGAGAPSVSVTCSRRIAGGFEGAVGLESADALRLFNQTSALENFRWEPSNAGSWNYVVLSAIAPDRLPPWDISDFRPILDGVDQPGGGTLTVTIPPRPAHLDPEEGRTYGFSMSADCVDGVVLTLTVPTGALPPITCDRAHGLSDGVAGATVTRQDMTRLRLRAGDRVRLAVRSTGRQTDQWRLWPLGP